MSRITRFAVLVVGLMSLFAMLSASAGAVTWHNSGNTNFSATGQNGTLSVTGVNLICTGANATGDAPTGTLVAATYSARGTAHFNGCTISGIPTTVNCGYTLTASSAPTAGTPSVFHGTADASCSVTQFGSEVCRIDGSTSGSYRNPALPVTGSLVLNTSNTLRTTNGAAGNCPLGAGEPAHLTSQTFTITTASGGAGTGGPVLARTP